MSRSKKIKYLLIFCFMFFIFNSCVTSLQKAVYADNIELVRQLAKKGKHLNTRKGIHAPPLQIAVSRSNKEITGILIEAGAKVYNDLFFSVKDTAICKLLVKHGGNFNVTNTAGDTPLHLAANPEVIKYFLQNGVKADQVSKLGDTPLLLAVLNKDYAKAELLIEFGADPDYTNPYGNSPMKMAVKTADKKMIEILAKKKTGK